MIKKISAIIVLSLAFSGIANADAFDDALANAQAGNYKAVFAGLKPLADQGRADAQLFLGFMYR